MKISITTTSTITMFTNLPEVEKMLIKNSFKVITVFPEEDIVVMIPMVPEPPLELK